MTAQIGPGDWVLLKAGTKNQTVGLVTDHINGGFYVKLYNRGAGARTVLFEESELTSLRNPGEPNWRPGDKVTRAGSSNVWEVVSHPYHYGDGRGWLVDLLSESESETHPCDSLKVYSKEALVRERAAEALYLEITLSPPTVNWDEVSESIKVRYRDLVSTVEQQLNKEDV